MGVETAAMIFLAGASALNQMSQQDAMESAQNRAMRAQEEAMNAQAAQQDKLIAAQTKTPPQELKQAAVRASGRNLMGSLPLGPTFLTGGAGSPLNPGNLAKPILGN